ncbi:MAG: hypothetical protein K2G32_06360 [Oscillospiraceae bacterium]|nr:hypothetical protein [Oscillospiraceae bacterium]
MSFKEEYGEYQRQIAPDEEFLERLAEKMDDEKQVKKKNRAVLRRVSFCASAVCAAAAAFIITFNLSHGSVDKPDIVSVGADKIDYREGLFSSGAEETGSVSPAELAEILAAEETVVYGSEKTVFDFDDKLNDEQKRELAQSLADAEETTAELGGSAEYYMAVTESGRVIKFSVSGNILEIGDIRYEI